MKTEIKTILAPVDFTQKSNNAVRLAAKMAQRHGAKLIISHVIYTYYLIDRGGKQVIGSKTLQESTILAQFHLERLKKILIEKYHLEIEIEVSTQNIVESVNTLVYSDKIDLVVVGTSGRQNFRHFFLGSNSYNILLHSNC